MATKAKQQRKSNARKAKLTAKASQKKSPKAPKARAAKKHARPKKVAKLGKVSAKRAVLGGVIERGEPREQKFPGATPPAKPLEGEVIPGIESSARLERGEPVEPDAPIGVENEDDVLEKESA